MNVRGAIRIALYIFRGYTSRRLSDTEGANQSTREWIAMAHTFEGVEGARGQCGATFLQLFPKSKWPAHRSHRRRSPSPYWLSVIIFIGHQFGTTVIFTMLFTFAWSLDFFCA